MKDISLVPLLAHKFKFIGLLVASTAAAILTLQKIDGKFFVSTLAEDQQSQLLFVMISLGLYIICFF
jgi:hypothetical protein